MTDALLLRPVPQRRHCVADRVLAAAGAGSCAAAGARIVAWWELVDPAQPDDAAPLGLVATRHRDETVVEIVRLVVTPSADLPASERVTLPARLLRSFVDVLRGASPARMLCAPRPVPDGLRPDHLVAAGFVPDGSGGYVLDL